MQEIWLDDSFSMSMGLDGTSIEQVLKLKLISNWNGWFWCYAYNDHCQVNIETAQSPAKCHQHK